MAITLFLLTLYSIVQTNAEVFHIENSRFLSMKILDTEAAATLFVTLLGALLVRHQFAIGVLPRINYKSKKADRRNQQNPDVPCETWHVELRNTGLGPAIINRTDYVLEHAGANNHFANFTFDDIVKELVKIDLVRDRDYWMDNFTPGFSVSPKDVYFVFEIKTEHIVKLKRLDMVIYFQGQLGDKYRREILLVPRP